jgi:DNA-binding transcriptional LysR family regulator
MFESAGRHLSFSGAAEELGVTRSAVGHSVTTLEAWLGIPLFVRTGRGLVLTDAGRRYHPVVSQSLAQLATAIEAVPGRRRSNQLRITLSPTFAARILVPRLASLRACLPDVSIHLDTTHKLAEFPRDGLDIAVRLGTGDWPELRAICLLKETLQPVAAPDLAARVGTVDQWDSIPIIVVSTVSHDWDAYLAATAFSINPHRVLVVDTLELAMRAAAHGLGVAIGHWPICRQEIDNGRLVALPWPIVESGVAYWLVARPETFMRPEVASFCEWALTELADLRAVSGSLS